MKKTFFECSYTSLWVSPADWKTTKLKSSLKKDWYVQCFFHDPLFKDKYPNGKEFRKRLNRFKTLEERKAAAEFYLEDIAKLLDKGYNPITKKFMLAEPEPNTAKLSPQTPAEDAIEDVWNKIREDALKNVSATGTANPKPFDDVRVAKNRFLKGLKELRYNEVPIKELSLSQIKETIVYLNITDGYYNKFLSYMSKLYTELIEYGCVENNPFKLYKKKKPVRKMREVLTEEEFLDITKYLKKHNYNFYRYCMIFHLSGARSTELMQLQVKDVDIAKQEYKVLIKKGNQYTEETKVILLDALELWKEITAESKQKDDYIFSTRLKPGPAPIAARQISRKWNKYVKVNYNKENDTDITADFYALKHFFLDKLDAQQFELLNNGSADLSTTNVAQIHASHRSPLITNSVYLVNKKKRERELIKKIKIL